MRVQSLPSMSLRLLGKAFHLAPLIALLALLEACSSPPPALGEAAIDDGVAVDEPLLAGGLTRAEGQVVLKLVDDICGDTWCEGDDNFRFRKIACSPRSHSCTLIFQMFPYDTEPTLASLRSCRTTGFSGFDSLVDTSDAGFQSLASGYYEALSSCISSME